MERVASRKRESVTEHPRCGHSSSRDTLPLPMRRSEKTAAARSRPPFCRWCWREGCTHDDSDGETSGHLVGRSWWAADDEDQTTTTWAPARVREESGEQSRAAGNATQKRGQDRDQRQRQRAKSSRTLSRARRLPARAHPPQRMARGASVLMAKFTGAGRSRRARAVSRWSMQGPA